MSLIRVVVQDGAGNDVSDAVDVPASLLLGSPIAPPTAYLGEPKLRCLGDVDPYGDTTFEHSMFRTILDDLDALKQVRGDEQQQEAIRRVEALVRRHLGKADHYLTFVGD